MQRAPGMVVETPACAGPPDINTNKPFQDFSICCTKAAPKSTYIGLRTGPRSREWDDFHHERTQTRPQSTGCLHQALERNMHLVSISALNGLVMGPFKGEGTRVQRTPSWLRRNMPANRGAIVILVFDGGSVGKTFQSILDALVHPGLQLRALLRLQEAFDRRCPASCSTECSWPSPTRPRRH